MGKDAFQNLYHFGEKRIKLLELKPLKIPNYVTIEKTFSFKGEKLSKMNIFSSITYNKIFLCKTYE